MKEAVKKDFWFYALIGLLVISCLVGYRRGITGVLKSSHLPIPIWYYYFNIALNTASLAALYFFYKMKKIGVILFIFFLIVDLGIQLLFGHTFNNALLFFIFLAAVLIGVKVIPNWKNYG